MRVFRLGLLALDLNTSFAAIEQTVKQFPNLNQYASSNNTRGSNDQAMPISRSI